MKRVEIRLTNIFPSSRVAIWVEPYPKQMSRMSVRSLQPVLTTDPIINTISEDKEFNFTVPGFGWNQHFIMFRVRHYAFCPVQMNLLAEDVIDQRHTINIVQTREFWPEEKVRKKRRKIIGPYGTPFYWDELE